MEAKVQFQLAEKAGNVNRVGYEGRTWLSEYEYHVGMVSNPLPFEQFRLKFNRLNQMFESDPDAKNPNFDRPIMVLCNELGY